MHITTGLSPCSGEMLDTPALFTEGVECTNFYIDHDIPESSHTVEIEYIYETPTKNVEKKKEETQDMDDQELTNLNWLQNITNIMSVPQFPLPPMSPNPQKPVAPQNTRLQKFNATMAKCQKDFEDHKEEYRSNSELKPPYSYSSLICMAMRYNNDKMTLSAIYSWIRDNFKYYRNADPTWQNSIRHNLSLNKVFVKIARSKQEPGKGGFWKLDLANLEGNKRISNRPHKKKKNPPEKVETSKVTEEAIAVSNIPHLTPIQGDITIDLNQPIQLHLPDFNFTALPDINLDGNIGANVIVEPAVPPPLIPEEDLTSLLLNPTEWDDLQLDMLDNYLDSCFK